jgi:DNA-binding transcriptional MerR regulator
MAIGDVLAELTHEFPAVSISKLRYLEDQGLVAPARTPSGYRKYSPADVERLRYVLAAQRDHYWPLRVIRAKLEALDIGLESVQAPLSLAGPRPAGARVGLDEAAALSGVDRDLVAEVAEAAGLDAGAGEADSALVGAVESVVELAERGIGVRHLRPVFAAATKEADLIETAAGALRSSGSAGRERAAAHAADLAELVGRLSRSLVRLALAQRGL